MIAWPLAKSSESRRPCMSSAAFIRQRGILGRAIRCYLHAARATITTSSLFRTFPMGADKVLNILALTAVGREVALADLGHADAPLAFARAKDAPPLHLTSPRFLNRRQ